MRYRYITGIAAVLILVDQLAKWLVIRNIRLHESFAITDFFSLVHVRNRGAAFGFLNDPGIEWQFWLFLLATLIAACIIFFVARGAEEKERLLFVALGCILGGALGNAVDRIRFRAVVDFLDFYYAGWHWPAFNVADIAICVGAGLSAVLLLRAPSRTSEKE